MSKEQPEINEVEQLRAEITIYKDQIDSLEKFSTIVVSQRNEAQTEVAKLTMLLNKAQGG